VLNRMVVAFFPPYYSYTNRCKKWRNSLITRQSKLKKAFLFTVAEFLFRISNPVRYNATRIFNLVRKQTILRNLDLIKSTLNKIVLRNCSLTRNFTLGRNHKVHGFWERRNSLNPTISGKATQNTIIPGHFSQHRV
jgi:hypothetical protein